MRGKGKYLSGTFLRKKDAEEWGLEIERNIDRGVLPNSPDPKSVRMFAKIIDLHIMDHQEVGKPIRRSKAAVFEALRASIGDMRIHDMTRNKLIEYGKTRAKGGAGPATLAIDFSFIGTLLTHAWTYPEKVEGILIA